MDTTQILKPTATINNSILSKSIRFLAAILLADWVLGNAIDIFIQNLNNKGLLGLGGDFQATFMVWGDTVWLNLLHLIILAFTAGLFGFLFGYLSRKVSSSERIIFTAIYVFIRFIFFGVISIIINNFFPNDSADFNQLVTEAVYAITSSGFNLAFVVLSHLAMFFSAFYLMNLGSRVISNPYYTIDQTTNGTLLGIRWYHYFWLFIPISFYSQIILNLLYRVGRTFVILATNFKWTTIFGLDDGEKGNAIDLAWGSLFFIFLAVMVIVYLMDYLRKILAGETSQNWAVKTLISIGISFIIPFLILWFTSLAG